jgi:hypothetical protein
MRLTARPQFDGRCGFWPDGPELVSENVQQTCALVGEVDGIKRGRAFESGKKGKEKCRRPPQVPVEKLNNDFGACES